MKKLLLFPIFILCFFTSEILAQTVQFQESQKTTSVQKNYPIHVSDKLNNSELMQRLRSNPSTASTRNKSMLIVDDEGDKRSFFVYNFVESNPQQDIFIFDQKQFRLMKKGDLTQIWFEIAEIENGHLNSAVADSMFKYLEEKSNPFSFNPNKGIIELSNEYLGNPPNYDGDGVVDFLITDIQDEWSPETGGGFTAGFFYGVDQNQDPGPGGNFRSNERDVLYIDSYPGIFNGNKADPLRPLGTLSHEYQHLIHYNYNSGSTGEITFINEAQSNFASLLSGYFPHSSYAGYLADTNVRLFRWSSGNDVLDDYGRAASFASYMWDQLGFENSGALTQNTLSGRAGITDTFSDLNAPFDFEEFLVNWSIANLINDKDVNSLYGYGHPFLTNLKAATRFNQPTINNQVIKVENGGTQFIAFQQVKNLEISVSSANTTTGEIRIVTNLSGDIDVQTLNSGSTFSTPSEQSYDQVYIVLVNTSTAGNEPLEFTVSANGEQTYTLSTLSTFEENIKFYWPVPYENDSGVGRLGFSNRYTINTDALIHSLELFIVSGQGADGEQIGVKGNGTLRIAAYTDENGQPGEVIADDSLDFAQIGSGWQTFNVTNWDLVLEEGSAVHIVYELMVPTLDRDVNSIPLRLDDGTGLQNVTHIVTGPSEFADMFTDTDTNGQHGVWNRLVLAEAVITNTEESGFTQPKEFKLSQNYPNPFNPSTNIDFALPQAMDVELRVYNSLGQQVATLVNSSLPAGSHSISWDAQDMASGLYIYRLVAGDNMLTRKMILMK
jgi:hypothetical protein